MIHCKISASYVLGWNKIKCMDWRKLYRWKKRNEGILTSHRKELSCGVQPTLFTFTAHTRRLSGSLGNRWSLIPCPDRTEQPTATQQPMNADKIHTIIVNIIVHLIQDSLRSLSLRSISTSQSQRAWVTTWLHEYHVTRLRHRRRER